MRSAFAFAFAFSLESEGTLRGPLALAGFGTISRMCAFADEVCGKEVSFAVSALRFRVAICLNELRLPRNIG
jgi:hypothetical protein